MIAHRTMRFTSLCIRALCGTLAGCAGRGAEGESAASGGMGRIRHGRRHTAASGCDWSVSSVVRHLLAQGLSEGRPRLTTLDVGVDHGKFG